MSPDRPQNIEEYKKWLEDSHAVSVTGRTETYYESVAHKMVKDFSDSAFWKGLPMELETINQEYFLTTGYKLVNTDVPAELRVKPFKSFVVKTFRKNVLENMNWPEAPREGWLLPPGWYARINDIMRTLIVVKYLVTISKRLIARVGDTRITHRRV